MAKPDHGAAEDSGQGSSSDEPSEAASPVGGNSPLEWFVPRGCRDFDQRQRIQVFAFSNIAAVPLTLALALVVRLEGGKEAAGLVRLVLLGVGLSALPLPLKWAGRLELFAAASAQLFCALILMIAFYSGGFVSPALPWLVVAFGSTAYYLVPWPRWRAANAVVQFAQVVVFALVAAYSPPPPFASDRTLLYLWIASSIALIALFQLLLNQVARMDAAKRRRLEREVAFRQAVEAELRRSREHLLFAQEVGRIGSAEMDVASQTLRWSDEMFSIFGLDLATTDVSLATYLDRIHPEDRGDVRAAMDLAVRRLPAEQIEARFIHSTGETRWISQQSESLIGTDGQTKVLFVVQDITKRKRAEEERASLEHQLQQAQKLDALGQLAGGVAHDFNNLLAVIHGRLEMAEEELAGMPEVRDWVRSAARATERGASLTKMMLAFARAQPLQQRDIDPSVVIGETTEMLRRLLGETIAIKAVTAPEQWHCEADPGQLQNALLNLAVNARDAMPRGGKLTIATRNIRLEAEDAAKIVGAKPGDYIEISVADDGTGMPPAVVARAFEPFFTTKEAGKGTGLGLSMVNGFVRQSGGYVTIDSQIGRGTTVRIHLPRRASRTREQTLGEAATRASGA